MKKDVRGKIAGTNYRTCYDILIYLKGAARDTADHVEIHIAILGGCGRVSTIWFFRKKRTNKKRRGKRSYKQLKQDMWL